MNIIKNLVVALSLAVVVPLCMASSEAPCEAAARAAGQEQAYKEQAHKQILGDNTIFTDPADIARAIGWRMKWEASVQRAMSGAQDYPIAASVGDAIKMADAASVSSECMPYAYGLSMVYAEESTKLVKDFERFCSSYEDFKYLNRGTERKEMFDRFGVGLRLQFLQFTETLKQGDLAIFCRAAQQKYTEIWDMLARVDRGGVLHRIFFGDLDPAILLLEHDHLINPMRPLCLTNSFFALAVSKNYSDLLNHVLEKNPSFAKKVRELASTEPLSFVIDWNLFSEDICNVLAKHGCLDLNAQNEDGETILTCQLRQYCSAWESAASSRFGDCRLEVQMPILFLLRYAKEMKESGRGPGLFVRLGSDEHKVLTRMLVGAGAASSALGDGVTFID